ncbi:MAG TPA: RIP metalloprotease RseP [Bacillota bacterium]|nr:RIP metalloprotease RseP [Bacillota bacterium]
MTTFIASVFVFGILIFFHEFGHYLAAKAAGIKVYEFSLGFGPKLFGFVKGETNYNLRSLPVGGFVRMAGMEPGEELSKEDEDRSFNKKPVGKRIGVIVSGPLMNFFLAVIILAVIFNFQGVPVPSESTRIGGVLPGYPAEGAGIAAGDEVLAVNGQRVENWRQLVDLVNRMPERDIKVTVLRDGAQKTLDVKTIRDEDGLGKIGIYQSSDYVKPGFFASIALGAEWTARVTIALMDFISKMIFGQAPPDLGGPVRVVSEIGKAAQVGFFFLLQIAAFLSINLGLFNLFPIPALDGSRILFLIWEKIRGRPVDPVKENFIHLVGFGLLLLFIIVITYNDIMQLLVGEKLPGRQ